MAFDTFAGAPDQERGSRGSPNTQLTATRSKRGGGRACRLSAMRGAATFMMRHRTTVRCNAASDQPVTVCDGPECPPAQRKRQHKLVTVGTMHVHQYSAAHA